MQNCICKYQKPRFEAGLYFFLKHIREVLLNRFLVSKFAIVALYRMTTYNKRNIRETVSAATARFMYRFPPAMLSLY